MGCLKVEPLIFRLVCTNGLIVPDKAHKKYHTGRQVEETMDDYSLFRDETLRQDDKAYFMKVQDIVRNAVDETAFGIAVDKFRRMKMKDIGPAPIAAVEVLGDTYQFTKREVDNVTQHFIHDDDLTQFGLINAVTRTANDIPDYERATEFERLGGQLLYTGLDDIIRKLDDRRKAS